MDLNPLTSSLRFPSGWLGLGFVVLAAVGIGLWSKLPAGRTVLSSDSLSKPVGHGNEPPPDVVRLNNEGVGLVEQYAFPNAVEAFEKVVAAAPGWLPGRINLGIALLNTNMPETIGRARGLFEEVLVEEKDNPYAHFCLGII